MDHLSRAVARFVTRLRQTLRLWQDDHGNTLAAGVAYYAACSFFPLVLLLIVALGIFLQFSAGAQDAEGRLLAIVETQTSAALAGHVQALLDGIRAGTFLGGPLGFIAALLVGLGVFIQFEIAFDRIFGIGESSATGPLATIQNVLFRRLRAFMVLMGVTILSLLLLAASLVFSALHQHFGGSLGIGAAWRMIQFSAMIGLNWLMFSTLYKALPKVPIKWVDAMRGGVLAAVLWEAIRQALALVLISKRYSAYGIVGSLLALMLWFYVASAALLFAAEYVRVLADERKAVRRD
jgi:membrane protein